MMYSLNIEIDEKEIAVIAPCFNGAQYSFITNSTNKNIADVFDMCGELIGHLVMYRTHGFGNLAIIAFSYSGSEKTFYTTTLSKQSFKQVYQHLEKEYPYAEEEKRTNKKTSKKSTNKKGAARKKGSNEKKHGSNSNPAKRRK